MVKRISVSVEAAFVLFVVSAAVGLLILFREQNIKPALIALSVSIPALASLILMLIVNSVESLLPGRQIRFPATFTLPILHCALMIVMVQLVLTTSNPLETVPPALRVAAIWQHWSVLVVCSAVGVASLSLIAKMGTAK